MNQWNSTVLANVKIAEDFYEMRISWGPGVDQPRAGQFVTIRVSDTTVPLLRRPFAIADFDLGSGTATILYRKIGTATELLAAKSSGDTIDCIGPLGNGFKMPPKKTGCLIIGGGTGAGPMVFLARSLKASGSEYKFIFGSRSKSSIPVNSCFDAAEPLLCTDDGSEGFKGTTADYLSATQEMYGPSTTLYCCGPMPMLKACHNFCMARSMTCWVSLEQTMACGVGACMGCVVPITRDPGFARICKEGPVFSSNEIVWD